jgi:Ni2+-binding GTPase involved in maturation of urease and hydrogenase
MASNELKYNAKQLVAINQLKKFIDAPTRNDVPFLLMGPGGSGKTTVITNIIQAYSELS